MIWKMYKVVSSNIMKNKFIITFFFLFTVNLYSQDIILIKDSILNNYKRSGFCSETFINSGKKDFSRRIGFWKTYSMVNDGVYISKDENGEPIIGTYWIYQEGEYQDGKKNGQWDLYAIEDLTFKKILYKQLHYKNGVKEGEYKYYHLNKKVARQGQYVSGVREGKTRVYYDTGKLKITLFYKNDSIEGKATFFYSNGKLERTAFYKNNLLEGKMIYFYSSGKIKSERNYIMNQLDGIYHYYHNNGKLWIEKLYSKGLLLNVTSNNDSNGNKRDKGTLKDGNGTLKLYDEKDILRRIETYKDGLKISEENF